MLNAVEYAYENRVPVELSDEMADFALFSLDMGDYLDEHKQPLLPHLGGKFVDLWKVKKVSKSILRDQQRKEDAEIAAEKDAKRQANLAKYISQGYAFDEKAK